MNTPRHTLRIAPAALLLLLAACADPPEESAQDRYEAAAAACPRLAEIQRDFGASIGGTYGEATLLEYRIRSSDGRTQVEPPNDSACAGEIAQRLVDVCSLCQQQAGTCLSLVTGVFAVPTNVCVYCGDGLCAPGQEDLASCPADCTCGNGLCDGTLTEPEDTLSCPQDCGGSCGDGYCARPVEECVCADDDPACAVCEQDCCVARCGDGRCDIEAGEASREAPSFCENDCGGGGCGDGVCQPFENGTSCPADCRDFLRCDPDQQPNRTDTPGSCFTDPDCGIGACGDGVCQAPETCYNCPEDCNITFTQIINGGSPVCFDGVCSACEVATCQADCAGVDFDCGNGVCDDGELPINCPQDCPWDTCTAPRCRDAARTGQCNDTLPPPPRVCTDAACGERCGDGLCGPAESATTCPEDCTSCRLYRQEAQQLPVCVRDEIACGRIELNGVWTDVVFDCGQRMEGCPDRPTVTPCDGRCSPTLDGAVCVDACPNPFLDTDPPMSDAEREERLRPRPLCGETFTPYCLSSNTTVACRIDPDYSADPACAVADVIYCEDACVVGTGCAEAPRLTGAQPAHVVEGSAWTLLGIFLGEQTGQVRFNDLNAQVLRWTPRLIEVTVPPGAAALPQPLTVTLERADGAVTFTEVTLADGPRINTFFPIGGYPEDPLRFDGVNFGAEQGEVLFTAHPRTGLPTVPAAIQAWSDTAVEVIIPADAVDGTVTLRTAAGDEATAAEVPVYSHLTIIDRIEPPAARTGETIRIHGRYLPPDPQVFFDNFNLQGTILDRTPNTIDVQVPAGISWRSTVYVGRASGANRSTFDYFYLLPEITGFRSCQEQPVTTVYVGEMIQLTGVDIPQALFEVVFPPGLAVSASGLGDRTRAIGIRVPVGAQSGPLRVVLAPGVEVTTPPLTVLGGDTDFTQPRWPMPDSQTAYCATDTATIPCAEAAQTNFNGQDGQRTQPAPSFSQSGGITTDNLTGLRWTAPLEAAMSWSDASCACIRGTFGGQSAGWRLPSTVELVSLMDLGAGRFQGINQDAAQLWTADQGSNAFWTVNPQGAVELEGGSNPTRALCVRDPDPTPNPAPRFTLTDDTALDNATGLMWQRANDATPRPWNQALFQCGEATTGGFDDWRLATLKEMMTLVDRSRAQPAFDDEVFFGIGRGDFWTSSPVPGQPGRAIVAGMEQGDARNSIPLSARGLMLCVRGG